MSVDERGVLVEWSPGAQRLFGWTREEALGQPASFFAPDANKEDVYHNIVRVARGDVVRGVRTVRVHKDGTRVDVEMTLTPVRDGDGALRGMWGLFTDASDRARLERVVTALERALSMLEGIAMAARRSEGLPELYREACRVAVERGGLRMAWVGRVDARTHQVAPVAHAGAEDGYLLQTSITLKEEPRGLGPTARCVRERRPVVCSDIEHDPSMLPWRDAALARGYRSAAAFPILDRGEVVATMAFYAAERDFFTPSALRLLGSIADILSSAVETARLRGGA